MIPALIAVLNDLCATPLQGTAKILKRQANDNTKAKPEARSEKLAARRYS
jgi:hypothetical protein